MFILLLKYTKPVEEVDLCVEAHREYLDGFCRSHNIIVAGKLVPRTGGVIIMRGMTKEEVERFIEKDPFTIHDVGDYEIIEFTPTKYDEDFNEYL